MTPDLLRRQYRRELHEQRCKDNDHSAQRYARDAQKLDDMLKAAGVFQYLTHWGDLTSARKHASDTD